MSDIAVVIPCFNMGRFVGEALESVLGQSRPAAEVVIVDDGSTDLYTRQRLAAIDDPRIRVVRTVNRGVGAARNYGIRSTSSEYVVTLDADDRLDGEYLATTATRLDADPGLGFITTAIRAFGEATYTWTPPPCDVANALVRGAAHPASMFRRQVWTAVGGFDESPALQGCADLDFWLSAMERGFRGEVVERPLLEYRVHSDSMHQALVSSGGQGRVMNLVLRKHCSSIAALGPDLLVEKNRFLEEQRNHRAMLVQRQACLAGELQAIEAEIGQTTQALRRLGVSPIDWGDIGAGEPFAPLGSGERGVPIDGFHARTFLLQHDDDRRGNVLVIRDPARDVEDGASEDGRSEYEATLTELSGLADDSFDCVVAAGALNHVYDVRSALLELRRVLRPGGVLLSTLPAVRPLTGGSADDSDYWRFAEAAVRQLMAEAFPSEPVSVTGRGNVMTCAASLLAMAADEVDPTDRDAVDPMFPLLYCVRAVKS